MPESYSSDVHADIARYSAGLGGATSQRQRQLDLRLREELSACFSANPDIDIGGIKVTVSHGSVILEGTAPSHLTRTHIVDLVSSCATVVLIRSSIRLADH